MDFNKNLSFETSGSVNLSFGNTSNFNPTNTTYDWAGNLVGQTAINTLNNGTSFNYRLLNENILRYGKKFGDRHDFSILAGHSVIYNRNNPNDYQLISEFMGNQ